MRAIAGLILFVVLLVAIAFTTSNQPSSVNNSPVTSEPSFPVTVTTIYVQSSDNACGLNGTTEPGFSGMSNAVSGETWQITAPSGGCTISSVSALIPGFLIPPSLSLPLSIPPGGTGSLSVSFFLPSGGYNGSLTVSVN